MLQSKLQATQMQRFFLKPNMIAKYIAIVLVAALLVIGAICSYFIASEMTVKVNSNVEVNVGANSKKPTKVMHYNISKNGF